MKRFVDIGWGERTNRRRGFCDEVPHRAKWIRHQTILEGGLSRKIKAQGRRRLKKGSWGTASRNDGKEETFYEPVTLPAERDQDIRARWLLMQPVSSRPNYSRNSPGKLVYLVRRGPARGRGRSGHERKEKIPAIASPPGSNGRQRAKRPGGSPKQLLTKVSRR